MIGSINGREPPRRIAVIGNAGTGKSTLARRTAEALGIECFHLDNLLWRPGWQMAPEAEFVRSHARLLEQSAWVIEGLGYPATIPARIAAADLVVLTRFPLWRCYWWSLKRELRPGTSVGRPQHCPMLPMVGRLGRAIWDVHWRILPDIEQALDGQGVAAEIVVLRSPADASRFLADVDSWKH
jgi:hypothetical protein